MPPIAFLRAGLIAGLVIAAGAGGFRRQFVVRAREDARPLASPIPRETVAYNGPYAPGTIIINTSERRLYLVLPGQGAEIRRRRRPAGLHLGGRRPTSPTSGNGRIGRRPPQMLKRRPDLPRHMEGGIDNPLGARAMYLAGTLYRIHGSNEPDTIGQAVSSGCIRMTNDDVTDLYSRAKVGAKVVVLR